MNFKEWFNKTPEELFGFSQTPNKKILDKSENMLNPLNFKIIFDELIHLGNIGVKIPYREFQDQIEWGNQPGALAVFTSPNGSLRVTIRKLINDSKGNSHWICKKVIPLNGQEFLESNTKEVNIAHTIYTELNNIDKTTFIESPKNYFPEFEKLVLKISDSVIRNHPESMLYEGTKKVNDDFYIIFCSYRGHGVELPTQLRCEQFNINVSFRQDSGIIHIWGNEIVSRTRKHEWKQRTPRFDEIFVPSQSFEEIVDCVNKSFNSY